MGVSPERDTIDTFHKATNLQENRPPFKGPGINGQALAEDNSVLRAPHAPREETPSRMVRRLQN